MSARSLLQWLQRIEALHPSDIELGLERVRNVYASFPAADIPPVITVAGTNGKGSTVECLTRCALASNRRVGTYTSPHLVRFNERMCINGAPASDADIVAAFETVEQARANIELTYFEFTTLAALALFRSVELDLWVLEVGLGGRLDAINIVDANVAVITAIGLDHQDWLGDDREVIGFEKAGIMRPGCVCVCSDPNPPASIEAHASDIGAQVLQLGRDYTYTPTEAAWNFEASTAVHQATAAAGNDIDSGGLNRQALPQPVGAVLDNLAGALAALSVSGLLPDDSQLRQVFTDWSFRGRLQRLDLDAVWWLDVAHNLESADLLARTLAKSMEQDSLTECIAVIGMLADKPVDQVIECLSPLVTHWLIVGLDSERALPPEDLAKKVQRVSPAKVEVLQSVAAGMAVARARAKRNDCVVVTGSFHTVGPALAWLSI